MAEDQFGAADQMQLPENDMAAERQQALRLAEVFTEAYLELKANAPNLDIDELRTSGQRGYLKLVGIDADDIDEELDYELLEREDFLWSQREDRE